MGTNFMGPVGQEVFYFYNTSVGDLTRYIHRYAKKDLKPSTGCVTNCFGVKIRKEFFPTILDDWKDIVEDKPIPANFHTDIAEIGSVLRTVDLAKSHFNMVELGCGWGCWMNIAGKVAKDKGLNVHLYGVEGDPGHVMLAQEALNDNGFTKEEYTLVNGIASANRGYALFPEQNNAGESYGEEPVFDATEEMMEELLKKNYKKLPQVTLDDIVSSGEVIDLLHLDIQGGELSFIHNSVEILNRRVAMMFVGTHSRYIEGELVQFLSENGWVLEVERPAILQVGGAISTLVDGCQLWRNPAFVNDIYASAVGAMGEVKITDKTKKSVKKGEVFNLEVIACNNSKTNWSSTSQAPCSLSYHWYDAETGEVVNYDGIRTNFTNGSLNSQSKVSQEMTITAPDKEGEYRLLITIVQDGVTWFEKETDFATDECIVSVS